MGFPEGAKLGFGLGAGEGENVDRSGGPVTAFVTPDTIDGCAANAPAVPADAPASK